MEAELIVSVTPPRNRQTSMICDFDDDPDLTTVSDFLGKKGTDTTIRLSIQPAEEFNLLSKTLQGFNDRFEAFETKFSAIDTELASTRDELASTQDRLSDVEARLDDTEEWIKDDVNAQLPLLQFNIRQRYAKKVFAVRLKEEVPKEEAVEPSLKSKGKNKAAQSPKIAHKSGASSKAPKLTTNDHQASTVRLIQDVKHITKAQLEAAAAEAEAAGHYKLSRKFFPYVKRLDDYRNERNDEAHDSGRAFAMIMLHPKFKDTMTYHAWRELVEYVYNMSLEELKKPKEKPMGKPEESKHEWKF